MAEKFDDTKKLDSSKESSISSVKIETGEPDHDSAFERRTMRYIDWRILPILAATYSFCLIDRVNLGTAHAAGMAVDLKMLKGDRFSIVILMYFIPYVLLQLPGNLVLRKFGVRNLLTFIVVAWGAVQLGMGFVNEWGYLVLCRVLLGTFEAAFFPSLLFIISTWYKRHEVQKRLAIFVLISVTAGGLSPIMAYVFSLLGGRGGLAGWKWIFIMEGIITISLGVLTWFFIPGFPDQNDFLTPEQTALVLRRIDEDRGDPTPDPLTFAVVVKHLKDWTLWAHGLNFCFAALPSYTQSIFMPIIFKGMGWSKTAALLLSAPPYAPSILTTMLIAHYSDKLKHRSSFIFFPTLLCIVGVALAAFAKQPEPRYFGAFLITMGNTGAVPTIIAWSSNNVVSHSKRSVQTALLVTLGGTGGIISSTVYRAKDAPRYIPGLSATMGAQVALILTVGILVAHYTRKNKQMREGKLKEPLEGQPGFYYTL